MNKPNKGITSSDLIVSLKKLSNYTDESTQISTATDILNNPNYYKSQSVYSYSMNSKDINYFINITNNNPNSIVICAFLKLLKRFTNNEKNCEILTTSEYIEIYEQLFRHHFMDKYDIYIYLAKLFIKIFKKNEMCLLPILKSAYILSRICSLISDKEKNSTQEQQIIYLKLIKILISNKKYQDIFGNSGIIEILCFDIIKNLAIKIKESTVTEKKDEEINNNNINKNSFSNIKINKNNNIDDNNSKSLNNSKKNKKVTIKDTKSKINDNNKLDVNSLNLKENSKVLLSEMSSKESLRSYSMNFYDEKMCNLDYNNFNDLIIELRLNVLQNICCLNDVFRHDAIVQNIIPIINIMIKNCFYPLNKQCFYILSNLMLSQNVSNVETIQSYLVSILPLTIHYISNEYLYLPISFIIRNIIFNFASIKSKFYTFHGIDAVFDGINIIIEKFNESNLKQEDELSYLYTVDNYVCILKNICLSSKAPTIKEVLLKYSKRLIDILNITLKNYYESYDEVSKIIIENNSQKNEHIMIIEGNKWFSNKKHHSYYFQYSKIDFEINVKGKYIEENNNPFKMIIDNLLSLIILVTNYENTSKFFFESGSLQEILNITKKIINKPPLKNIIIEKLLQCIENMSLFIISSQRIFECLGNILINYVYNQTTINIKLKSLCIIYNIITFNENISNFIFHLSSGLIEEIIANISSVNNDYRDIAIKIVNFYVMRNDQEINEKLCKHGCLEQLSVVINSNNKILINNSILNIATLSYLKLDEFKSTNFDFCIKMQNEWKQRDIYFKDTNKKKDTNKTSKKTENKKETNTSTNKKSLKNVTKKLINVKRITNTKKIKKAAT